MRIADTNVLLGLILPDRPTHTALSESALDADASSVVVTEGVLVEAAGVLAWSYGHSRADVAELLLAALESPGLRAWDHPLATSALRLMLAEPSLGLVDCLLLERGLRLSDEVLTFDAHVLRLASRYVEI